MKAEAVTVGVPVRDLDLAIAWYQSAFELGEPDQIPMDGLAEFDLGALWLQLALSPELAGSYGLSLNIGVKDASAEQQKFAERGLTVTALQRFEGAVEFFEVTDRDGNKIGFVTELS
ncbi:VOC family protein [Cryobacterium roopkundense]|uniref:Putative enzyme related to lactoylglutathione lyase n=1 Tax=Cryobacterium roopkundense TaxID=1001240 RepID=A0A7W9E472_9MICO|nr:VOC family protein [Cryobacterium roopkundense]MBB5641124.1 putative enzyme related to lactoylglutathione lyase [Cryobacterium roopkundense]